MSDVTITRDPRLGKVNAKYRLIEAPFASKPFFYRYHPQISFRRSARAKKFAKPIKGICVMALQTTYYSVYIPPKYITWYSRDKTKRKKKKFYHFIFDEWANEQMSRWRLKLGLVRKLKTRDFPCHQQAEDHKSSMSFMSLANWRLEVVHAVSTDSRETVHS